MGWRVAETDVKAIVSTDSDLSLAPFINMANRLTDRVASNDTDGDLAVNDLYDIELLLAAHFYSLRDQRLQSESGGKASGSYQGQTGKGLESTDYGTNAIALDSTGTLAGLARQKHRVGAAWLGKIEDNQIDYDDREAN